MDIPTFGFYFYWRSNLTGLFSDRPHNFPASGYRAGGVGRLPHFPAHRLQSDTKGGDKHLGKMALIFRLYQIGRHSSPSRMRHLLRQRHLPAFGSDFTHHLPNSAHLEGGLQIPSRRKDRLLLGRGYLPYLVLCLQVWNVVYYAVRFGFLWTWGDSAD